MRQYHLFVVIMVAILITSCEDSVTTPSREVIDTTYPIAMTAQFQGQYDTHSIQTVNSNGEELQAILEDTTRNLNLLQWSPDGARILYYTSIGGLPPLYSIYEMDADGGNHRKLFDNESSMTHLRQSPDGSMFVYTAPGAEFFRQLHIINSDGTGKRIISDGLAWDRYPQWSPDSQKILFLSERAPTYYTNLYTVNIDGSGQIQLTTEGFVVYDDKWSPDGSQIAFIGKKDPFFYLYLMNIDGTERIELIKSKDFTETLRWSPDGNHIMFTQVSEDIGIFQLYLINRDGSGLRRLTHNPDYVRSAKWGPDGTKIFFVPNAAGTRNLHSVDFDGTNLQQLTFFDDCSGINFIISSMMTLK